MSAFIYVAPDLSVLGMSVVFGPSDGWALKRPALVASPDLIRVRAATAPYLFISKHSAWLFSLISANYKHRQVGR